MLNWVNYVFCRCGTYKLCILQLSYDVSLYTADVVEVKFDYDAEQPDELSLRVGDIIRNCKLVEDGWLEGELHGKRGIFPDNFVAKKEITPPPGVTCVCMCAYVRGVYVCVYRYTYVRIYVCMYIMYILKLCQ